MSDDPAGADGPENPDRRLLLGGLAAAVGMAAVGPAGASTPSDGAAAKPEAALRHHIDTIVVIYAENRSFNNLFAGFPDFSNRFRWCRGNVFCNATAMAGCWISFRRSGAEWFQTSRSWTIANI